MAREQRIRDHQALVRARALLLEAARAVGLGGWDPAGDPELRALPVRARPREALGLRAGVVERNLGLAYSLAHRRARYLRSVGLAVDVEECKQAAAEALTTPPPALRMWWRRHARGLQWRLMQTPEKTGHLDATWIAAMPEDPLRALLALLIRISPASSKWNLTIYSSMYKECRIELPVQSQEDAELRAQVIVSGAEQEYLDSIVRIDASNDSTLNRAIKFILDLQSHNFGVNVNTDAGKRCDDLIAACEEVFPKERRFPLSKEIVSELDTFRNSLKERDREARKHMASIESMNRRLNKLFEESRLQIQKDIESSQALYHEHMALKAPVTYWDATVSKYSSLAKKWGCASLGVAGLFIFAFVLYAFLMFPKDGGLPPAQVIAVAVSLFVLVLWGLRIMVRMYLSASQIANDAEHRSVLAQTYLAFQEKDNVLDNESQKAIIDALFRPVSAGIIADDGPMNSIEAIAKVFKR